MRYFFLLLLFCTTSILYAQITTIEGIVIDKATKEPLPFATVQFTGTAIGTTTNMDGFFSLKTDDLSLESLDVNYLGYDPKTVRFKEEKENILSIKLTETTAKLETVVIRAKRKQKKDTIAIALYKRIMENKDKNQPSNFDTYSYEEYAKTQFDIHNVKEKLVNRKILKPIDFVFENMDTTEKGEVFLPLLLKEKLSTVEYRKDIDKTKRTVKADQFSGVDNDNLSSQVDYNFPEIDIYQNTIDLGGKGFVSPFSKNATIIYKYFLTDSTTIDDRFCYVLQFTPRRKGDLAFTGTAWIDKETAAIKTVDVYVLDQINVNFLSGLKFQQSYKYLEEKAWFKEKEQMEIIANLTESKKQQAIRITRTAHLYDIKINEPIEKSTFDGDALVIQDGYSKRSKDFWKENRKFELSETEENIYTYVERIKKTQAYKVSKYIGHSVGTGYFNLGIVEVGRWLQFWSRNALEGNRYRIGLRTDPRRFRDKFSIEGYVAYGDKDKLFKYHLGSKIHLKRVNKKWHMVGGHYRYDWSDYNFQNSYMTHDHTINSLLRTRLLNNLFLIREGHLFYEKEWVRGLTNKFTGTHKTVYQWPDSFQLPSNSETEGTEESTAFQAFEVSAGARWGLDQVFQNFGGGFEREQIDINAPVLNFKYTLGIKDLLGGDYAYHKLSGDFSQKITSKLGRSYYTIGGEKIWGEIPYPLLKIHKGNQSILYNRQSYNMMDDLEFVTDASAYIHLRHHFDGFILNTIPLINRLKMRTAFFAKGIYGTLSSTNQQLFTNDDLSDLNGYYAEAGFGVENIAKLVNMHFIWRLTQRDSANVPLFAIKIYIAPSF